MFGGELVAKGTLAEVCALPHSPTGQALSDPMTASAARRAPTRGVGFQPTVARFQRQGPRSQKAREKREWRRPSSRRVARTGHTTSGSPGCHANNLRDLTIAIPLQRLTVITGVSGSGKSSFMRGVLQPGGRRRNLRQKAKIPARRGAPLPARSSSTPSTRSTSRRSARPAARRPRPTSRFSTKSANCLPACPSRGCAASRPAGFPSTPRADAARPAKGNGQIKLEMNFLPTSYVPCDECHGLRYNAATLEVEYNGRNIGQVMEHDHRGGGRIFCRACRIIARTLRLLVETGLGYLQLGQPSPTLSGGEAQRIKLVTELTKASAAASARGCGKTGRPSGSLYLIEEPTIGLHPQDVRRLIDVLHRLVDDGHTVVVIEHNLDVIAEADYLLDIGPEAGDGGGRAGGGGHAGIGGHGARQPDGAVSARHTGGAATTGPAIGECGKVGRDLPGAQAVNASRGGGMPVCSRVVAGARIGPTPEDVYGPAAVRAHRRRAWKARLTPGQRLGCLPGPLARWFSPEPEDPLVDGSGSPVSVGALPGARRKRVVLAQVSPWALAPTIPTSAGARPRAGLVAPLRGGRWLAAARATWTRPCQ